MWQMLDEWQSKCLFSYDFKKELLNRTKVYAVIFEGKKYNTWKPIITEHIEHNFSSTGFRIKNIWTKVLSVESHFVTNSSL